VGKDTGIKWTDHTFNPWWGCTKVSLGCDHCYAEVVDARYGGEVSHWGKGAPRRVFGEKHWNEPLQWNALAARMNRIEKVFCASMADVMDDEAPKGQRERLWKLIDATPNLMWQLLTKRPHRYFRYLPSTLFVHRNVILGTTTENQDSYDVRMVPLEHAAALAGVQTFISYEPALGSITMRNGLVRPNWVIFGGETGAGHRPMEQKWAEDIKAECEEFGIPFFMKQMGAHNPTKASALIPAHLLLRQFPATTAGE
jgi:protein gp37